MSKSNGLPEMVFHVMDTPIAPVETVAAAPTPAAPPAPPAAAMRAPKAKKETATAGNWKQRGLHLSDDVCIRLRIMAMKKGTSASKLADQILKKHLPALMEIVAAA
jgi:hypothetical protein